MEQLNTDQPAATPGANRPMRPLLMKRIVLIFNGEEIRGRSTDPANLDADKNTVPQYQPYTSEVWIDHDNVTVYKCTDQTRGMELIHTFSRDQLATISNVWQQLFAFNNGFHIPVDE